MKMPELHTYKLFISHAWDYNDEYYRMIDMLNQAANFKYANYSVPEHNPVDPQEKLKEALKRQIRPVEVVLILSGMYVDYSKWIQFEMDFAESLVKPIIGVKPWGQQRIPVELQDTAVEMVGWNTSSIVDAIRQNA